MAAKRKTSAKTRVKLSQAAKRRQRAPSGSAYGGQFLSGLIPTLGGVHKAKSKKFRNSGDVPRESRPRPVDTKDERSKTDTRRLASSNKNDIQNELRRAGVESNIDRERLSRRYTYDRTYRQTSRLGHPETPTVEDMTGGPVTVNFSTRREVNRRLADSRWKTDKDIYGYTWKDKKDPRKRPLSVTEFQRREMAPSHQQEFDKWIDDPHSFLNEGTEPGATPRGRFQSAGARRRAEKYTASLQQGKSHEEAVGEAVSDRRGRSTTGTSKEYVARTVTKEDLDRTRGAGARGKGNKYETLNMKPDEFKFGVEATLPRSAEKLKEIFPGLTDKEYVQLREADRMSISDELAKNVKWAQETKRAQILSQETGKPTPPDRVVFFTTNLGHPSLSVPSDSLVGQYIINRRKTALRKEQAATKTALRGEFPAVVRDQHIIEIKAMGGAGAAGRYGLFQESGVRVGSKRFGGYGKRSPVGSQVLTDSGGRPIYDAKGNIVFTEGASRPFEVGTENVYGLRVFIG